MVKNIVILLLVVVLGGVSYYAYQQKAKAEFSERIIKQRDGHIFTLENSLENSRKLAEECMKEAVDRMRMDAAAKSEINKRKK